MGAATSVGEKWLATATSIWAPPSARRAAAADWLVDLGPEGGADGGHVVFAGPPSDIVDCQASHTGSWLREHL